MIGVGPCAPAICSGLLLAASFAAQAAVPVRDYECQTIAVESEHPPGNFGAPSIDGTGNVAFFGGPGVLSCCRDSSGTPDVMDLGAAEIARYTANYVSDTPALASGGDVWFLGAPFSGGGKTIYRWTPPLATPTPVVEVDLGSSPPPEAFADLGTPVPVSSGVLFVAIRADGTGGVFTQGGIRLLEISGLVPDVSSTTGLVASPYAADFFAFSDGIDVAVFPNEPPGLPAELPIGALSVGGTTLPPQIAYSYSDSTLPGTFELRINDRVLVDETTDPEITATGAVSINKFEEVLFVAEDQLYVASESDLHRVKCVNEDDLPSGVYQSPPTHHEISPRSFNDAGRVAFRAETFVGERFVVIARPVPQPAAGLLGGAATGALVALRARWLRGRSVSR